VATLDQILIHITVDDDDDDEQDGNEIKHNDEEWMKRLTIVVGC